MRFDAETQTFVLTADEYDHLRGEVLFAKAENERMRNFMRLRTLDGERTELDVYEDTKARDQ